MQLPPQLRAALEALSEGRSTGDLARSYAALSDRYRRKTNGVSFQIENADEALAYALARLPATFGAVSSALEQLRIALPDFAPLSVLDIGAGPGTATLAAAQSFSLENARLVEPNLPLRTMAKHLLSTTTINANFEAATLATADYSAPSDLVLVSYVLNEVQEDRLASYLSDLWSATSGALVILEPGTPLGYGIVLKARDILLSFGAQIAAPCPHTQDCPMKGTERWCHMSTRIERSSLHKKLKEDAALGYEDEKFSYLVATRDQPHRPNARLVGHPRGQKLISAELCMADGTLQTPTLSKRDPLYKQARKADWGDGLETP